MIYKAVTIEPGIYFLADNSCCDEINFCVRSIGCTGYYDLKTMELKKKSGKKFNAEWFKTHSKIVSDIFKSFRSIPYINEQHINKYIMTSKKQELESDTCLKAHIMSQAFLIVFQNMNQ
jgi:hypothetical protein